MDTLIPNLIFKGEWIHSKSILKNVLKPFKQNQTQSQITNEKENLDSGSKEFSRQEWEVNDHAL